MPEFYLHVFNFCLFVLHRLLCRVVWLVVIHVLNIILDFAPILLVCAMCIVFSGGDTIAIVWSVRPSDVE